MKNIFTAIRENLATIIRKSLTTIIKIFITIFHYFGVLSLGMFIAAWLDYGFDMTILLGIIVAALIALGSGLSIYFDIVDNANNAETEEEWSEEIDIVIEDDDED